MRGRRLVSISSSRWLGAKANVSLQTSLGFQRGQDWIIHLTVFTHIIGYCVGSIVILYLIFVVLGGVSDCLLLLIDV